jgi:hypothetical protein
MSDLVAYDAARAALDRAGSVNEVKDVRDRAEALRVYAKRAGLGLEAQNHCAVLKLRAERKAGEILCNMPIAKGWITNDSVSLESVGVTAHDSSRWQKLARIDEGDFETYLANAIAARVEITQAAALRLSKPIVDKEHTEAEYDDPAPLPPIDAEAFEEAVRDRRLMSHLIELTEQALRACSPQQRHLYRRAIVEGEEVATIARDLGVSRQSAHDGLVLAQSHVWLHIGQSTAAFARRVDSGDADLGGDYYIDDAAAVAIEATGTTTLDKTTAGDTMLRYTQRSEQRITLGAGSEDMERVEKRGPGATTNTMRISAHQRHARGGNR